MKKIIVGLLFLSVLVFTACAPKTKEEISSDISGASQIISEDLSDNVLSAVSEEISDEKSTETQREPNGFEMTPPSRSNDDISDVMTAEGKLNEVLVKRTIAGDGELNWNLWNEDSAPSETVIDGEEAYCFEMRWNADVETVGGGLIGIYAITKDGNKIYELDRGVYPEVWVELNPNAKF